MAIWFFDNVDINLFSWVNDTLWSIIAFLALTMLSTILLQFRFTSNRSTSMGLLLLIFFTLSLYAIAMLVFPVMSKAKPDFRIILVWLGIS